MLCFCQLILQVIYIKDKGKESRNMPGVAQRVPGGLGSQTSWHSACESGEVVSLTHRLPLPPGMLLVLIFTRSWVDPRTMVRSEGNMSLKNPPTPPEVYPGSVRLLSQRLNHYAPPGHQVIYIYIYIYVCVCERNEVSLNLRVFSVTILRSAVLKLE